MAGKKWRKAYGVGNAMKILKHPAGQIATETECCCVECCGRVLPATLYAEITVDSDCNCQPWYPTLILPIVYGALPESEWGVNCFEWYGEFDLCVVGGNMQTLGVGLCCRGENEAIDLTLYLRGCGSAIGITPDVDATCDPLYLSFPDDDGTGGYNISGCCDPDVTGKGAVLSVKIRETP